MHQEVIAGDRLAVQGAGTCRMQNPERSHTCQQSRGGHDKQEASHLGEVKDGPVGKGVWILMRHSRLLRTGRREPRCAALRSAGWS